MNITKEMFTEHTPLELYELRRKRIWVKRDDLFARWPSPPLGKLRGALVVLEKLHSQGVNTVGCWDTRISALGQGIAACALRFPNMRVIVAYPATKGSVVPEPLRLAAELGAEVLPVKAGRLTISFAAARHEVERRGGSMLPFGLECNESVDAVAKEAATVPSEYLEGGTVVVSCGSGVTLAGLVLGMGARPRRFIGVSSGRSVSAIKRCLMKYNAPLNCVTLIPAESSYAKAWDGAVPFPSHSHYDKKAWAYLEKSANTLRHPILFWNVGAEGTGQAQSV